MLTTEDQSISRIFTCPECPKVFATRSNLKRHMENPNIHNIPYVRSRDQKRWKGHNKKIISKEETTESNNDRMRKWRAENREKNRQNDLRCRVYRLARQKYGDHDSMEKQGFVREEIARRLGRRMVMEQQDVHELPFYSAPQQKIELPAILSRRTSSSSSTSSVTSRRRSSTGDDFCVLPAMLSYNAVKYVESNKILDEFVGVVLNYVDNQ